jgi:hypothetical protein
MSRKSTLNLLKSSLSLDKKSSTGFNLLSLESIERLQEPEEQVAAAPEAAEAEDDDSLKKLLAFSTKRKLLFVICSIFAVIEGFMLPLVGFLSAQILVADFKYPLDPEYY